MIDKKEMEAINRGFITLNVIWAAMLLSLFIYLSVGHYLKDSMAISFEEKALQFFRNALYVVSAVTLIATFYLRKLFLRTTRISSRQVRPAHSPAVARYLTALVVTLALSESIGIYGLIFFFLGKEIMDLYIFIAISAAAMIYYRPQKQEIIELANEFNKQCRG